MKVVIVMITLLSTQAFAQMGSTTLGNLECATYTNSTGTAMSCVSKISMEKDRVQLEVAKLQLEKLQEEQARGKKKK